VSRDAAIVAAATPWGRSAIAVIRASGPSLDGLVAAWLTPMGPRPLGPSGPRRVQVRGPDGAVVDDGMALWQRGPRTYTGEDTLEVSIHGNPLLVELALQGAVAAGARLADPGAFTRRAVALGRMDLLAAEGVDQAIRATSLAGLQIARDGLDGRVRAALEPLRSALLDVGAELEARLDYPADELAFEDDAALLARLADAAARARALADTAAAGRVLVDGARVALVGAVNAGKSSLFNALCGSRRALVHDRPGTTRDVLELPVRIGGLQLTLLDTAGERQTDDPIEAAGQALARELVADADLLLVVLRAGPPSEVEATLLARTADRPRLVVYNGIDRPGAPPAPPGAWPTSAHTGAGLDALRAALVDRLVAAPTGGLRLGSTRQRDLLRAFADAADAAAEALPLAGPAVAAEEVLRAIGEIDALTGADPREAVLDAVFRRFCIGK